MELPHRPKLRRLSELPSWRKSSTATAEPNFEHPNTDIIEPRCT
jgi:hypothetical protein